VVEAEMKTSSQQVVHQTNLKIQGVYHSIFLFFVL